MARIPLTAETRKAVAARDGGACQKCGRRDGLQVHHIVNVIDGGTNDLENLATLCSLCHNEWHLVLGVHIPWDRWLKLPPASIVLRWLVMMNDTPAYDAMSFREANRVLLATFESTRSLSQEDDEG